MLFLTETAQQTDAFGGMAKFLDLFLLVTLFGCSIYGFYTVIRLRKTLFLFPNKFLYPNGCKPEDCLDEDGFIDYILPRLTLLSIGLLLLGIAYAVKIYVFPHVQHLAVEIATMLVPFGILLWYGFIQRKAFKLFWEVL